jgi:Raf kinase inhibitor-like YbhB/YbcL family protein
MKQELRARKARKSARALCAAAIALLGCVLVSLALWRQQSASAHEKGRADLRLESTSFVDGGDIPRQFTCDGADVSPELHWPSPPAGTRSLAILMTDPDAPIEFTHWLTYNIPADVRGLAEGASVRPTMPKGSNEGLNNFGRIGYGGPCPPPGKPHHYMFHVYALDAHLNPPVGPNRKELEAAMSGHVLAEGQLIGIYRRPTQ